MLQRLRFFFSRASFACTMGEPLRRRVDQFREGSSISIAEIETRYCPVSLLKRSIEVGEHSPDSFLVRKISHTKASFRLRKQKLSYSRALELFKKTIEKDTSGSQFVWFAQFMFRRGQGYWIA